MGDFAKLAAGTLSLMGPNTFTGDVTVSGGFVAIDAESRLGNGALTLDGGGLKALADFTLARAVAVGAGGGEFDTAGHTVVINGALSGTSGLIKSGAGTLRLAGVSAAFTGTVEVELGLLDVTGALAAAPVSIEAGGALGGSGTVGAATVLSGGTVAPGNNLGRLTTGPFDLQSGAQLVLELGGLVAPTQYDQLKVVGSVSLAGELQLSLFNGFTPQVGNKFFLVLNDGTDSVTGGFSNVIGGMITIPFATFSVSMTDNGDAGTVGNDVSITYVTVPEPGSCSLLAAGLVAGALRRRRGASKAGTGLIPG
jgi:autotransporter-associated beta strand protein